MHNREMPMGLRKEKGIYWELSKILEFHHNIIAQSAEVVEYTNCFSAEE